jgi:carboxyl-terminal processing protease
MTIIRFSLRRRKAVTTIVCAVLALAGSRFAQAQEPPPGQGIGVSARKDKPAEKAKAPTAKVPGLTAELVSKNVQSFEVVWKTVRDRHFDPKLGGLNWQAVHDELRPKVERAKTMAEARAVMSEAIDRLGQTHFEIIPSGLYDDLENPNEGPGEVGLDVRLLDGRVVVTAVDQALPASRAGVKPGWIIEQIDGKEVNKILKTAEAAYSRSGMVAVYKIIAVIRRLHAQVGSKIGFDFLDSSEKPVHKDLIAKEPVGVPADFGHLPTFYVQFTSRRIEGSVGYVSLNTFFDAVNVLKQFGEAIEANRDADGLVIDLRGNPGGMGIMSFAMANWFVTKPGLKLGTMITRAGSANFPLIPRQNPYQKPVAVLVDELSMSTSEIFAGGLRDLKLARIFGTKTPGAALPSMVEMLPNGDRFQFAVANYISAGGKPLEGVGVEPDVITPLSRAALVEGRDPALDAAVNWIRSGHAKS